MDYETLYAKMIAAAEDAITAIEQCNYGQAKELLIAAELACEEQYIQADTTP